MPPKKKNAKKSGKKSGKGKKGKSKEPVITFQEAILAYRIGLVEKQIEDVKFDESNLEEQKERFTDRNQRLLEEQSQYIKLLLKQSKEFEKRNLSAEKIGKTHVMKALEEKWEACKDEDKKLEEMQAEILSIEKTISRVRKEKARWLDYKANGSHHRAKQIELLEKELRDMKESYDEMIEHMSRNLEVSREKIISHLDWTLDTQKHSASEKAMATLDKKDRQEVLDNDWMKVEVERYEELCDLMQKEVEVVERENLNLMSELFNCNVEDLKITRNLFLTQFDDAETLAEGGILEVDLKKVSLLERAKELMYSISDGAESTGIQSEPEEQLDEHYEERPLTPATDADDPFDNYYGFHDDDMTEYLKLGPLQLKLLSLSGEQKPIYVQGGSTEEEIKAREYNPENWPVTQPMMKSVTKHNTGVF
ncbi:coiled-coil domain-containing protein 83-like [Watersipora subatra]|uniref:coiled-coil domain-containing protein 83-like n=1 Tax=Watersipora subatra TaxID=2589382 RepID=UPI00355C3205